MTGSVPQDITLDTNCKFRLLPELLTNCCRSEVPAKPFLGFDSFDLAHRTHRSVSLFFPVYDDGYDKGYRGAVGGRGSQCEVRKGPGTGEALLREPGHAGASPAQKFTESPCWESLWNSRPQRPPFLRRSVGAAGSSSPLTLAFLATGRILRLELPCPSQRLAYTQVRGVGAHHEWQAPSKFGGCLELCARNLTRRPSLFLRAPYQQHFLYSVSLLFSMYILHLKCRIGRTNIYLIVQVK